MSARLKKNLNVYDVFTITSGTMISSGLFILPALIYTIVGPSAFLVYILAGLMVVPALFSKLELTTAMPRAGGSYFIVERSLGFFAGTVGGFACWLSMSFKSAFALFGIGEFSAFVFPGITTLQIKSVAILFCLLFMILNLTSVRRTGKMQSVFVLFLISILVVFIIRGLFLVDGDKYVPLFIGGKNNFYLAVGMVFISFGGLTKAASVAEEVKNPQKSIPRGILSAFFVVLLLYGLTVFVTVGVLEGFEIKSTMIPLSLAGTKIMGSAGGVLMSVGAMIAFASTANAGILSASRFPVAMGRDGILPNIFSKINPRSNTPCFSIVFTCAIMISSITFLDLTSLVKIASVMEISVYIFETISLIIMRQSRLLNYKPTYIAPLYPWLQILGIFVYVFFIIKIGFFAISSFVLFMAICALFAKFFVKNKQNRISALRHIIERFKPNSNTISSLDSELKLILKDREPEPLFLEKVLKI